MFIYKITNLTNGKCYIGQTQKTIEERWKQHLNGYENLNFALYRAMRKYGVMVWKIEEIEKVDTLELLNEREVFWIKHYKSMKNGYNMTSGGQHNVEYTEEVLNKLRRPKTEEEKKNMSLSAKKRMARQDNHGKNNRGFKRFYITPWGKFPCVEEAYINCPYENKMSRDMIWIYCMNSDKKILKTNNLKYFAKECLGKSYRELGFYREDVR